MNREKTIGYIVALIAALSAALFGFAYKNVCLLLSPITACFSLLFIAFLISSAFSFKSLSRTNFQKIKPSHLWKFLSLGLAGFVGNYAGAEALLVLHPPIVQSIQRSEIIFAVLLSAMLLHEKLSIAVLTALVAIVAGMLLLYNFQNASEIVHYHYYFFPILTAFCFAMLSIIFQTMKDLDPSFINACRLIISVFPIVFFSDSLQEILNAPMEVFIWLTIAAFLGPFLNRVSYTYAARGIGVSKTAIIMSLAPVMSLFLGMIFYQIFLTMPQILGIMSIVLGTILIMIYDNKK